jgi:UV DNA damage endonuclease
MLICAFLLTGQKRDDLRCSLYNPFMDWKKRLGFACVIAGRKGLRAADGRRAKNSPHLRHSLQGLLGVFDYLEEIDVRLFRLPSALIPYATHPDYPRFHWKKQIEEASNEIELIRKRREELSLRLSFHPSQFVLLNSPRKEVTKNSLEELRWQAKILDLFGCGPEARVLIHAGGVYDDRAAARTRLVREINKLPQAIHRRFALENDDRSWSASEILAISRETDVPFVFDLHHHACLNKGEPWDEMLRAALQTWGKTRAKIHLSSPRLMGDKLNLRAHADYIDPWMFSRLLEKTPDLDFDIMLEAKKKDLALLRLREKAVLGQTLP